MTIVPHNLCNGSILLADNPWHPSHCLLGRNSTVKRFATRTTYSILVENNRPIFALDVDPNK